MAWVLEEWIYHPDSLGTELDTNPDQFDYLGVIQVVVSGSEKTER